MVVNQTHDLTYWDMRFDWVRYEKTNKMRSDWVWHEKANREMQREWKMKV